MDFDGKQLSTKWLHGGGSAHNERWLNYRLSFGTVVITGVDTLVPPRRTRSFHNHGTGVTISMEQP